MSDEPFGRGGNWETKECRDVIKSLHQWLHSQGIPEGDWGPILACAAGYEVQRICEKTKEAQSFGVKLLTRLLIEWAEKDRLNV